MDANEYRRKQIGWDRKSLDKRVERWQQIVPATYNVPLPKLLWGYLSEVDEMYIAGHFIGVIVLCAGIAELVLADQIQKRTSMALAEVKRLRLEQLEKKGRQLAVLEGDEAERFAVLRMLRNNLILR